MAGKSSPLLFFAMAAALAAILTGTAVGVRAPHDAAKLNMVTAIYVFGDSTADVGNNNHLPGDKAKANFPHYGVDFPGGVATGRFSNGYNVIDFLAQKMGYRQSPPPVLSIQNSTELVSGGMNFASGGSGILNATGQNVSLSFNTQVELFETKVVAELTKSLGGQGARQFLSEAVFSISVGNNDMFGYFTTHGPSSVAAKDEFVRLLVTTHKAQLRRLYDLGARKFAILGMSLVGCVPISRLRNPTGECIEDLNDLARRYNDGVTKDVLKALSVEAVGFKYSFTSAYRIVADVLSKPVEFGYKELQSACCGTGKLNAVSGCSPIATYCPDRRQYLFWDAVHPTEGAYQLVAERAYTGSPPNVTPMNVLQLVNS